MERLRHPPRAGVRLDARRYLVGLHHRRRLLRVDVHMGRAPAGPQRPQAVRVRRRHPGEPRVLPGQFHDLARHALRVLRRARRRRQRIRLFHADAGRLEMVPRQARSRRRPDGRRLRRRAGDLRHAGQRVAHPVARLANDVPDPCRDLFRDDDVRGDAAAESSAGIPAGGLDAACRRARGAHGFHDRRNAADVDVLFPVDRLRVRDHRRTDGDQSARPVRAHRRSGRHHRDLLAGRHLLRQRGRPRAFRLAVGHARPSADAEDDGAVVSRGDAGVVSVARAGRAVFRADRAVYWCYGTQLSLFASTTGDFSERRTWA